MISEGLKTDDPNADPNADPMPIPMLIRLISRQASRKPPLLMHSTLPSQAASSTQAFLVSSSQAIYPIPA
jgi:hypothetical protein